MTIRQRSANSFELIVKHRLLERPFSTSFPTREEAEVYKQKLKALLDAGYVPPELQQKRAVCVGRWSLRDAQQAYTNRLARSESDTAWLLTVIKEVGDTPVSSVSVRWAMDWVGRMQQAHLAPVTIRHRVGALARCLDWLLLEQPEQLSINPLRLLPRGYASYSVSAFGEHARVDVERDRRLAPGEEERIRQELEKFPAHWRLMFTLAVSTAMRLREMYTLAPDQVVLARRTVYLSKTKNGSRREVPLASDAMAALQAYQMPERLVFPVWDGDPATLKQTTAKVSRWWARRFEAAGCPDLVFHDLRHEATCRLFERTQLTDTQIARITGHKDPRMLRRYASLRGSDLAERLW